MRLRISEVGGIQESQYPPRIGSKHIIRSLVIIVNDYVDNRTKGNRKPLARCFFSSEMEVEGIKKFERAVGMRCSGTLHKRRQASGGEPRLVGWSVGDGDEIRR
jgi:hypothetical protein